MKLTFEQYQELRSLNQYQPHANVVDIMAALDVSDRRAEKLLAEYNQIIQSLEHPMERVDGVPVYGYGSMAAMLVETAIEKLRDWPVGVDASDAERTAARDSIPACIIVGKFRERIGGGVPASGGANYILRGNYVTGYAAGGEPTYSEWIGCSQRHEPETRNKIGGLGAWREIRNDAGIERAVKQLARSIQAHA